MIESLVQTLSEILVISPALPNEAAGQVCKSRLVTLAQKFASFCADVIAGGPVIFLQAAIANVFLSQPTVSVFI